MKIVSKKDTLIIIFSLIVTTLLYNTSVEYEKHVFREICYPIIGNKASTSGVTTIINESGIPIVDYGYYNEVFIGKQINPVTVSQKAFYYESEYQKGNESCKQLFLNNANYLVETATRCNNYTLWKYNYPWPPYGIASPWVSAMAQGQGIDVLIHAYNMTGDKKYLNSAHLALNAFYVEVKDGGITYKDHNGWWYEEYVTGTNVQPRVLNGMIFSLFGIYEYYEFTGDQNAKVLFNQGIISLKNNLYKYDAGSWTYYDALGYEASPSYNEIHVNQLLQLYEITKDPFFKEYYEKFKGYDQNPIYSIRYGIKYKILDYFIYITNFIFLVVAFEITSTNRFKNICAKYISVILKDIH
jgi:heparosan-N-sulfate-glucuronate 5-epimerase